MKKIILLSVFLVSIGSVQSYAKDWTFGAGLVYGESFSEEGAGLTHTRVDFYALNRKFPSWTAKVGYAQQQNLTTGSREDWGGAYPSYIFEPTSDVLIFGIGYNLINYKSFFLDLGIVYNYIISQTNYDNTVTARYDNGAYWKADTLRFNSSPGAEVGIGYSFSDFSIRTDFTFVANVFEFEENLYNSDGTLQSSQPEKQSYGNLFATIGLTYWF